jgi:acylpyruvate hydrolase
LRYASCERQGRRFIASIEDGAVSPFAGHRELNSLAIGSGLPTLELTGESFPIDEIRFRPLIPEPRKIICLGTNYPAHAEETSRELPSYPRLFPKFADSLIGAYDPIRLPPESEQVDFEVELAVVIGTPTRRVSEADALSAVAGYTVANDVSVRDFQFRSDQLLPGKAWSAMTPIGPWLVTPDEIEDPQQLGLELELNGEVMQQASSAEMIFPIAKIIAIVSEFLLLEPGDVILTGTPAGVGFLRRPPVFLSAGDEMVTTIESIGRLVNPVVRDGSSSL